ncbi:MAG: hypothetical protein LBT64_00710 [Puniceicoccales bacterium]|jgi:hypothetical protein|nr:hypothetical protein [Puniceicoccales bacterium]
MSRIEAQQGQQVIGGGVNGCSSNIYARTSVSKTPPPNQAQQAHGGSINSNCIKSAATRSTAVQQNSPTGAPKKPAGASGNNGTSSKSSITTQRNLSMNIQQKSKKYNTQQLNKLYEIKSRCKEMLSGEKKLLKSSQAKHDDKVDNAAMDAANAITKLEEAERSPTTDNIKAAKDAMDKANKSLKNVSKDKSEGIRDSLDKLYARALASKATTKLDSAISNPTTDNIKAAKDAVDDAKKSLKSVGGKHAELMCIKLESKYACALAAEAIQISEKNPTLENIKNANEKLATADEKSQHYYSNGASHMLGADKLSYDEYMELVNTLAGQKSSIRDITHDAADKKLDEAIKDLDRGESERAYPLCREAYDMANLSSKMEKEVAKNSDTVAGHEYGHEEDLQKASATRKENIDKKSSEMLSKAHEKGINVSPGQKAKKVLKIVGIVLGISLAVALIGLVACLLLVIGGPLFLYSTSRNVEEINEASHRNRYNYN